MEHVWCKPFKYKLRYSIVPVKQKKLRKIAIIFLSITCFGCSKEPSHPDCSFEYPQHMFWLRNKKNNFQLPTLIWGPGIQAPK